MSTEQEQLAIESVMTDFTTALNEGDLSKVADLYTEDGIFMPDEFKSLEGNKLGKTGSNPFLTSGFKINLKVEKIDATAEYAFVTAEAKTTKDNKTKTSRDFFVLRRENLDWKIYRYIYNSSSTKA